MTEPIILGKTQAKAMRYVEFPKIKWPHDFIMQPTTLEKIITTKTPTPETAIGPPPIDSDGTTPRVHVHKSQPR